MKKILCLMAGIMLCGMAAIAQTTKIYDMAEQMPQYARGEKALSEYLSQSLVYPQDAKDQGVQGRVMVQFVVETDGSCSHISVLRSPGLRSIENEAIRLINDMKDESWIPAKQNGQLVRCRYTQTITFRL